MKDNQTVSFVINLPAESATINVKGIGALQFDAKKAHDNVRRMAMMKGFCQQRIVDKSAIARADKNGKVRSAQTMAQMKYDAMQSIIAHIESGSDSWSTRATAEDKSAIQLAGFMRVVKCDAERANAIINAKAIEHGREFKEELAFLAQSQAIRLAILDIERERLSDSANDADDALSELTGGE